MITQKYTVQRLHSVTSNGQVYHLTSEAIHPLQDDQPRYAQLYILDTDEAVHHRMRIQGNSTCD